MSKAVLLSIQPRYCENIASGRKKIEVRKSKPSLETPFKCYIFCTASESLRIVGGRRTGKSLTPQGVVCNGKVIGEFICDEIKCYEAELHNSTLYESISEVYKVGDGEYEYHCVADNEEDEDEVAFFQQTCLTWKDFRKYLGQDFHIFYGWHISDLKIYDEPKKLWEFKKPCDHVNDCCTCKRAKHSLLFGTPFFQCCDDEITRPPQSWCYVEEIQE